jgi:hypothetical protein
MLRSKYEKSTDLVNHFIITEHKELNGSFYNKCDSINLNYSILEYLFMLFKIFKIKNHEKK